MTDMDGAPPSPSHGDKGGFNSSGVRDHLLWALSYGVASAIALRTIDALTSKRTNQPGSEKPKEKEKEKVEEKTTTTNPTVCHVNVFPSVTTITNSKDSSTLVSTKKEDQTATAASSTPTKVSEKNGVNTPAVAASNGGVLGLFSRPQAPQAKALPPPICKHVLDFYYDCLHVASEKKCEGYINLTEKCHQMGPTSADISNVSDDRQNSTLHPPAELLHMSYHGTYEYITVRGLRMAGKMDNVVPKVGWNDTNLIPKPTLFPRWALWRWSSTSPSGEGTLATRQGLRTSKG